MGECVKLWKSCSLGFYFCLWYMCVFYTQECVYTCVYSLLSPLLVEAKVQPPSSSSMSLHLLFRTESLSTPGVHCFSCPYCWFSPDIWLRLIPSTGLRCTFLPTFYMDIGHLKSCLGVYIESTLPTEPSHPSLLFFRHFKGNSFH